MYPIIKYQHELTWDDVHLLLDNSDIKWGEYAKLFPQPPWCWHPHAVRPVCIYEGIKPELGLGCAELFNHKVETRRSCGYCQYAYPLKKKPVKPPYKTKVNIGLNGTEVDSLKRMPVHNMLMLATDIFRDRDYTELKLIQGEAETIKLMLLQVMDAAKERELKIIMLRYGLDSGEIRTRRTVGYIVDLSQRRVRDLETLGVSRMRRHDRAHELWNYLEIIPRGE